jgi:hypothetical protein
LIATRRFTLRKWGVHGGKVRVCGARGKQNLQAEFAKGWNFLPGFQRHAFGKAQGVKAETLKR